MSYIATEPAILQSFKNVIIQGEEYMGQNTPLTNSLIC